MSKIESALAKARGRVRLEAVKTSAPGTNIVPVESRSMLVGDAERVAASKALTRMEDSVLVEPRTLAERRMIHIGMPDIEAVTAFRELRTKILQIAQRSCTILVTSSARARAGDSTASNLAMAFALDESKTALLLDCNLESPKLDHMLTARGAPGIVDYLKNDEIGVERVIHAVGVRRLRLIPAGQSRDRMAEYFTSTKMRELLQELRHRYVDRYIVLDAPPITESADARILAELADYVVLVVPYGAATESQIAAAAKLISEKKLLGIVFSDMPRLPTRGLGLPWWLALADKLWRSIAGKSAKSN
jgi:protein-tyrosine kinase